MKLTGNEKKYLRGLAHHLDPVIHIGKNGLTDAVITSIVEVLFAHELVKIKFIDYKEEKEELSTEIAEKTKSGLAGIIGNIAIFYKPHPDKELREIDLKNA